MVGDDAEADVAAVRAGLRGILVQSGEYRAGDEAKLPDGAAVARDIGMAEEMAGTFPGLQHA